MDIIQKFGNAVSSMSLEDPGKARRLLLTGYRLQEKRLLFFSDKKLPKSGQYVARIVMKNIIQALSKPENSAMVSIFVPGELLTADLFLFHTPVPQMLVADLDRRRAKACVVYLDIIDHCQIQERLIRNLL